MYSLAERSSIAAMRDTSRNSRSVRLSFTGSVRLTSFATGNPWNQVVSVLPEWMRSVREAHEVADELAVLQTALREGISAGVLTESCALSEPCDVGAGQGFDGFDFDHESVRLFACLEGLWFDQFGPDCPPVVAHLLTGDFPTTLALNGNAHSRG